MILILALSLKRSKYIKCKIKIKLYWINIINAIPNSLIHFDLFNFLKFKKKHRNTKLGCYINFSRFLAINQSISIDLFNLN